MKKQIIGAARKILPRSLRDKIFHFAYNIAREEFDKFSYQYAYAPNMRYALMAAKQRGLNPSIILDIGAFEGGWSRMSRSIWPDASIVMIEGNEEKRNKLEPVARDLDARILFSLLGAEEGKKIDFYVMESGSSVYEEESAYERTKTTKTIRSLDTLLSNVERVDFIKIDTQGYELEVLKGAVRLLASAEAVLLEVSLIEINKGAPLIADVFSFMKARGFAAYDIVEIHRRQFDRATNQVDVLFLREDSPLRANRSFT